MTAPIPELAPVTRITLFFKQGYCGVTITNYQHNTDSSVLNQKLPAAKYLIEKDINKSDGDGLSASWREGAGDRTGCWSRLRPRGKRLVLKDYFS